MDKARIPSKAAALGYSGVIPFAAATAIVAFGDDRLRQLALDGFLIYGAVILSFLGGIRWGAASTDVGDPGRGLLLSVLPSLWAALALWWLPDKAAAWWLMAGFIVMGLADGLFPGPNVPEWMKSLRTRLTVAVVACHLLVTSTF
jgi:hypothetical protein